MSAKKLAEIDLKISEKEAQAKAHISTILGAIDGAPPEALEEAASLARIALQRAGENLRKLRGENGRILKPI